VRVKSLILCADDYAFNTAVSAGIVELLAAKRLTATSCMTNMPLWPSLAPELTQLKTSAQIGLHFNLTDGEALTSPLSFSKQLPSLKSLIINSYARRLNKAEVKAELQAQLAAFVHSMQRFPDFIDGHQHIHQLPVVRDALLEVVHEELLANPHFYLRATSYGFGLALQQVDKMKSFIIAGLGGNKFSHKLTQANIAHNSSFSGIYDFAPQCDYREQFLKFLALSQDKGLIMCHPAIDAKDQQDEIAVARVNEYQYFKSPQFSHDLIEHGWAI
jgi:predicted glycoside hydrolase/deacetylase ChbG (UPF0249 family)